MTHITSFRVRQPASGPSWLSDYSRSVENLFRQMMPGPFMLHGYETAEIPDAATQWTHCLIYDHDVDAVYHCTGTDWVRLMDYNAGAALTKTDDTNVTLTLGGTPATALLEATSLTLGWTGTLAVARGGTGASDASGARTNLGLAIGTNVQAFDATLSALASYNTNGFLCQTAADTFAGRTITGTANEITITSGDGGAGNPTLSLASSLTFTGKTITGGSFANVTIAGTSTAINQGTIDCAGVDIKDATTDRTSNFTLMPAHASTHQRVTSGSRTITIPDNATQAIAVGSWIVIVNDAAGTTQTLSRSAGVVLNWGGADANRSLAAPGWARLEKVGTDSWYVYGNGIS